MNHLLDFLIRGEFLIDALGVLGLGMVALAAIRLANRYRSWGGSLLAAGAFMLLFGRIWFVAAEQLLTHEMKHSMGETWTSVLSIAPSALLTMGLAGIVWGLWSHEQWLREER